MCGIVGVATTKGREEAVRAVERALDVLGHRGPDDRGAAIVWEGRGAGGAHWTVCFGHRRLSILDLSPAGHQPLRDEERGNWITYNGEVFNHEELRPALCAQGSRSDTEVVLKSFGQGGKEAIGAWRGMFAFGFWEAARARLWLVRDRLGIKPLYYYDTPETCVFGSEIRAILASGLVPRRLSSEAIEQFLAYGSVEAPLTMVDGVRAVLPGHLVEYKDGETRTERYWQLVPEAPEETSPARPEQVMEEVTALTREAVRLWRISDVPISLFLSGGIDSGALLSLLRRGSSDAIHTFCLEFDRETSVARAPRWEEGASAAAIAQRYGAIHTTVTRTEAEVRQRLGHAVAALDQPSIDGINTWFLSEAVAEAGFKVALSGVGGDEGFLGYRFFQTLPRDERWRRGWEEAPDWLRVWAAGTISKLPLGRWQSRAAKLEAILGERMADLDTVRLYRQLFTRSQRRRLLGSEGRPSWVDHEVATWTFHDRLNRASALELSGYLPNTLLRDTDTMSMAHGLEVRVPLLDHPLIERVLRLPGGVKLRPGQPKWLLIAAAGDLPTTIQQQKKQGFELPFDRWLRGPLREEMADSLASRTLEGLIDRPAAGEVWQQFLGRRLTWSRVWALYVLQQWMERHLLSPQRDEGATR
jgi:asparagine synthase (glutamine-hydrolysing)